MTEPRVISVPADHSQELHIFVREDRELKKYDLVDIYTRSGGFRSRVVVLEPVISINVEGLPSIMVKTVSKHPGDGYVLEVLCEPKSYEDQPHAP